MENKNLLIPVFLLVAVFVIGFAFYQYFTSATSEQEEQEPDPSQITYPIITPQEVVDAFLSWYISGDNVLPSDAYTTAEALTDNFKETLTTLLETPDAVPYDSFVCSENIPSSEEIMTLPAQISGTTANVVVETMMEEEENSFIYELTLVDGAWKIDNIFCFIKG